MYGVSRGEGTEKSDIAVVCCVSADLAEATRESEEELIDGDEVEFEEEAVLLRLRVVTAAMVCV